ncbi:unnamed protein product, partial [marine sediment metagenome]
MLGVPIGMHQYYSHGSEAQAAHPGQGLMGSGYIERRDDVASSIDSLVDLDDAAVQWLR